MVRLVNFVFYQNYLQAGIGEIEPYLLSRELFWPLNISSSSEGSYPNLTLGGFLLYQRFALIIARTNPQQTFCQKIETQLDVLRSRWRVAWERKAAWEFQSRLRQWGHILSEIRERPRENASYYQYEVRIRVILALLSSEIGEVDTAYIEEFESQDLLLRGLLEPREFIWDAELASRFPNEVYWYLWGLPKGD